MMKRKKEVEELFDIWEFRFIDKEIRTGAVIYARTEEAAIKIINMWNDMQSIYHWVKPRFRFKKRFVTSMPPYELEQEQIKTIEGWKKKMLNAKS